MENLNLHENDKQPTVNGRMYGPLASVIITALIYFASQLVVVLVISALPIIKGWSRQHAIDWLQSNPWGTFLLISLVEAATLLLLHIFLMPKKLSFRSLGLDTPKAAFIAYALSGFAVYFIMYIAGLILVKRLFPGLNLDQKQELGFDTSTQGSSLWPIFISLVVLPPLTEEIVVRGFLFGGLRTKLPFVSSAIIASALFAAAHLSEGGSGGLLWVAGVDTFILSLVLCYLRDKTGSLWPSIGVHALKNGLAFIVLFNIFQYLK